MPSKIEWTNETWNPLAGCSVISPGCTNCYAMREAGGRLRSSAKFAGLTQPSKAGSVWTGEIRLWDRVLEQPLRWKSPRMIFVNSMSDLFHENAQDDWLDRIFEIIGACDDQRLGHTFQILTKRADRQRDYMKSDRAYVAWNKRRLAQEAWPPRNIWSGVSVEDQRRADERIPLLRNTPAAVRWVSLEPLLSAVDISPWVGLSAGPQWYVVGGESGPGARPFNIEWARSVIRQCKAAGVACFVKQLGRWPVGESPATIPPGAPPRVYQISLRDRKGGDISEFPTDLQIREYPS